MNQPARISFAFIFAILVLAGWLHLGALLLAVLFSLFALTKLDFLHPPRKWLAVTLFLALLAILSFALTYFIDETVDALPHIARKAVPALIKWANDHQITLPFTDLESLKIAALEFARRQAVNLGKFADFARGATEHFIYLVIGCLVAIELFLHPGLDLDAKSSPAHPTLYSLSCVEISRRFSLFFESFAIVMNAQMTIAAINTLLTGIFAIAVGLPHIVVAVGATFLCGLIPVIGNLVSNALVVALGFMISPAKGLAALVFLVAVHKLEYLLNGKIIGRRIRSPIWLTLLALLLGERLMGITGMILAPVLLHYLRVETSKIHLKPPTPNPALRT